MIILLTLSIVPGWVPMPFGIALGITAGTRPARLHSDTV